MKATISTLRPTATISPPRQDTEIAAQATRATVEATPSSSIPNLATKATSLTTQVVVGRAIITHLQTMQAITTLITGSQVDLSVTNDTTTPLREILIA